MFCYKNSKSWQSDLWFVFNPFPSQKHLNCLDVLILAWNLLKHNGEFFLSTKLCIEYICFLYIPHLYFYSSWAVFWREEKDACLQGEGGGAGIPPPTRGSWLGGHDALSAYQRAVQLYILYCIAKLTLSIQCNYKHHYICMSCSCNSLPWTICSLKIGVIS